VRHADSGQWQLVRRVDDVQLPDTLQGLILARIDRLADESKQALKLASVIGRSFFDRVLEAISETRGELRRCLSDLQQAELIREKQRLPDLEYMFKHALVQEATYGSILADNRRAIHQRVAQSIEALFPDRLDEFATLLAHHYTCAEDWEKAQAYLFKAGDQAGRMAADTEALEHLRLAEAAYLKARGDKLEPLQRAALARKVGAALFGTGRYEAAHEQMRQALSHLGVIYPSTRAGVLRAALGYLGAHGWRVLRARLGWPAPRRMDLAVATEISTIAHMMAWSDYFLDKERMLLDSLLELHVGECSEHALAEARGLSAVGFGMMTFGARKLARRYHHRAQGVAQRSANVSAIAFSWFALAFVDFYDGHWDPFDTRMGKAVTGYRESGDLHRWGSPAMMVSWVQIARGDLERARTLMTEVVRVGKDAADPQISSWGLQVLGRALIALGPLSEAEAALREGADIALRIHSLDNLLHLQAMLVSCLVLQGRLAECPPLLDEAHAIIRREKMNRDFDAVEVLVADAGTVLHWPRAFRVRRGRGAGPGPRGLPRGPALRPSHAAVAADDAAPARPLRLAARRPQRRRPGLARKPEGRRTCQLPGRTGPDAAGDRTAHGRRRRGPPGRAAVPPDGCAHLPGPGRAHGHPNACRRVGGRLAEPLSGRA
jgi:tetratricopeptide (TPR) repeat protein